MKNFVLALLVVAGLAAVSEACPVAVQSFGVQAFSGHCGVVQQQAIVQSHVPVQAFAVPFAVVPQAVVVQQHGVVVRQQNVRQRSFNRTVVRQRSR